MVTHHTRGRYALAPIVLAAVALLLVVPPDLVATLLVVLAILTIPVTVSAALLGSYLSGRDGAGSDARNP